MMRRAFTLLLAGLVCAAVGLATAADDPAPDEADPPIRLKKKRPAPDKEEPGKKEPGKKAPEPKEEDPEKPGKLKGKAREKDEPIIPEDGRPGEPEQDEKELLDRVGRNMRSVEEKLANREVGDPTRQRQEDILRDLDELIRKSQQQGGGGGGQQDQQPQGGGGEQGDDMQKGGGGQPKGGQPKGAGQQKGSGQQKGGQAGQGGPGGRQQAGTGRRRSQRPGRSGQKQGLAKGEGQGTGQPKEEGSGSGNQGGAGKDSPPGGPKDRNADLYKDIWGHLPESMRAEMNAYSNPSPFLPRYDDLIKKYYRTIAEQGRRKGD